MLTSDVLLLRDAGSGQAQGSRQYQEDRCTSILPDKFPSKTDDKVAFFAIYDGHGSELVADHASKNLHSLLAKRPEFDQGDYEAAIKGALADEDGIILADFKKRPSRMAFSGSTVALCLVNLTEGALVVANLGDSHIVIAERDPKTDCPHHIRRLSKSHKPDVPAEKSRIEEAGGSVKCRNGIARLGGLNLSRSLGDFQYKNPVNTFPDGPLSAASHLASSVAPSARGNFLSVEPHTARLSLLPDRRYVVVIASDGISDCIDDTKLIYYVMGLWKRGLSASDIAHKVATAAAGVPYSDNGTCIVALLDGLGSNT